MRGREGQLHFLWTHTPVSTLLLLTPARAAVLNLGAATPLGVTNQTSCVSDIYIRIHHGSKIAVMKKQQSNVVVG